MTGNEARKLFLDYFKQHNHRIVRSSSLVPQADPTLLFVNAGMVQFKRIFIGEEKRDYTTAATSQKCVRAGGKHNDLENVGYTARHHTFFEMLGNFSFGDYFKEKAIELTWDLLLNGYGLDASSLLVSVYQDDDEAYGIWKDKMGVPQDHIFRLGEKDNFWSMGDTGPCGPCSEIHIDRGEAAGCGQPDCQVGCDCDRYLEIWNMVFMQYNRDASGEMTPLPKPSIDTGMGLERITSVVQNTPTNYETDLFLPIIHTIESAAQKTFSQDPEENICMKVIADHARSTAFLIGDGVLPSNDGRGYVLRRIMRRAIRYGRDLGLTKPFLHNTVNAVFDTMAAAYPELKEARSFITNVIENEEVRFSETLDNGLRLLQETLDDLRAKGESVISGAVLFKLYDTFGFPVDLARDVVRESDITLDMDGFNAAMADQRAQSRSVTDFSETNEAYRELSEQGLATTFVGYNTLTAAAEVLAVVIPDEDNDPDAEATIELVADTTPFYGESGGQVGDMGTICGPQGEMQVVDTIKDPTGLTIHKGRLKTGTINKGESVTAAVDPDTRRATALNHTATHLLHAALRDIVGDHVKQAGSRVSPDRLRFDFTHFSQIEPDTLEAIERFVNYWVSKNLDVQIEERAIEDALEDGATALFEEKYGDTVRVISINKVSKELCGGTHTPRTGDIGLFKIVSEASVASGVRRIEALTGTAAITFMQENLRALNETAGLLKEPPLALPPRIHKIVKESRRLEKEVEQLKTKLAAASVSGSGGSEETAGHQMINDVKVIAREVAADTPGALRELADQLKDKLQSGIVVLAAANPPKVFLIVAVTKDLVKRFKAGDIIREPAAILGGGGGGRPDMAQAGGSKPEKINEAIETACNIISSF